MMFLKLAGFSRVSRCAHRQSAIYYTLLYSTRHFLTKVGAIIIASNAVTVAEAECHLSLTPYWNLPFGAYTTCHSHFRVAVVGAVEKHGTCGLLLPAPMSFKPKASRLLKYRHGKYISRFVYYISLYNVWNFHKSEIVTDEFVRNVCRDVFE